MHIITLNIPWPPDYGGMIDSYYRIQCLSDAGINIRLHCFEYGREHSAKLDALCHTVDYYGRDISFRRHFTYLPFTVSSRLSEALLTKLVEDDHPILFDGLHTTALLAHPSLAGRRKFVRVHNIEHRYYGSLAGFEKNLIKRLYYSLESAKLKRYERVLAEADYLFTVSMSDQEHFRKRFGNAELIPSFHPFSKVESIEGSGDYIIFHGDLTVNENEVVAKYLIREIFSKVPYRCVIAGKNPSPGLISEAGRFSNVSIAGDPTEAEMKDLIRNAHINLLCALAPNGLKLKLLMALFSGRHCLVNENILDGTSLGPACIVENSAKDIIRTINDLMEKPFTSAMIAERESILEPYSNNFNCRRLTSMIFP